MIKINNGEYMLCIRRITLIFCMLLSTIIYSQAQETTQASDEVDMTDNATENTSISNANITNISTTNTFSTNETRKIFLNIDDAVTYARRNDILLIESLFDYEIARARKWQTTSDLYMPGLAITGDFNYLDGESASLGGSATIYGLEGNADQWSGSLELSRVLFNGLRFWNNNKVSEINLKMAEETFIYCVDG